jgi:hypothetical protein
MKFPGSTFGSAGSIRLGPFQADGGAHRSTSCVIPARFTPAPPQGAGRALFNSAASSSPRRLISVALAQGSYDLSWWTVDGGGAESGGGSYTMVGTIGQPDAGVSMSGGGYTLAGGFWGVGSAGGPGLNIYLPVMPKNSQPLSAVERGTVVDEKLVSKFRDLSRL